MTIQCAHAKCIHRTQNMQCELALQGKTILLNVVGQCEMLETVRNEYVVSSSVNKTNSLVFEELPEQIKCSRHGCENPSFYICTSCGSHICEQHETDHIIGKDDDGKDMFFPLCNMCFQRHIERAHQIRDDRDDPDDPWQMLEGAF